MSTVWLNATETEVYSASLLLSMLAMMAADRAGRDGAVSSLVLAAYALALAVPLHLSALVVAPGVILLAAQDARSWVRWSRFAILASVTVLVFAIGVASWWLMLLSLVLLCIVIAARRERRVAALAVPLAVLLAMSAIAILPIRAAHDPMLNEGNVHDWRTLAAVIGRQQYGGLPLYPRQSPFWLQLLNLFEYIDWQVALGIHQGVAPSVGRTAITLLFVALALVGSRAHRVADPRCWRAFMAVFAAASLGLVVVLNFKAGASIGYGLFSIEPAHEVRERDYFFSLAFWIWGAWAGFGAVHLMRRRWPALAPAGLVVSALPLLLNWRAVDRRVPDSLAHRLGSALLWSAPARAVLVTGGDNDSFPLWYLQTVEGARPDVTVVVAPLLAASWYRDELWRRDSLLVRERDRPRGLTSLMQQIAADAASRERPLAIALTAGADARNSVGGPWALRGVDFVRDSGSTAPWSNVVGGGIDTSAALQFTARFAADSDRVVFELAGYAAGSRTDPSERLAAQWLLCPMRAVRALRSGVRADSLDSACNF